MFAGLVVCGFSFLLLSVTILMLKHGFLAKQIRAEVKTA